MQLPTTKELEVSRLGPCEVPSPLVGHGEMFVADDSRVLASSDPRDLEEILGSGEPAPAFEQAGARERIFFDPSKLTCGIVTCGGICPGVNDVIRSLVLTLTHSYGVRRILGFQYGYSGLAADSPHRPRELTPEIVEAVHHEGGTLLGSSRGAQDVADMASTLVRNGVGILFVIGGDGTVRGASALAEEIARRGLGISVIGIPKTIDNDLMWVQRSFGFTTAVASASEAIRAAHTEARGAWNGVGLLKLMGRYSGFVAANATLSNPDVNFCLVPEVPFRLHGESGFLPALEARLLLKHHAVVVVAEGAGQELLHEPSGAERDASGNVRLKDVGPFLRNEIRRHFDRRKIPADVKYIDPSYIIRSLPASPLDSGFSLMLGQMAVHAGMAGRTDMMVGYWNQAFTHVPIPLVAGRRKQVDPRGDIWRAVLQSTGQPASMMSGQPA